MKTAVAAVAAVGAAAAALLALRRWRKAASSSVAGESAVGVVGLGVMGSQLVLNFAEKLERPISGFDLDAKKAASTTAAGQAEGFTVSTFTSLADFVASLERPRRVLLLVPAGKPVEAAISSLMPLLDKGDVIVDFGNEWYQNTEARQKRVEPTGIHYVGCGLSGGGEGARRGPCLMPGGPREAWELLQPLFEVRRAPCRPPAGVARRHVFFGAARRAHARPVRSHRRAVGRAAVLTFARLLGRLTSCSAVVRVLAQSIAARIHVSAGMAAGSGGAGWPCVRYIGPGGSGHYVKMVHNGIEYDATPRTIAFILLPCGDVGAHATSRMPDRPCMLTWQVRRHAAHLRGRLLLPRGRRAERERGVDLLREAQRRPARLLPHGDDRRRHAQTGRALAGQGPGGRGLRLVRLQGDGQMDHPAGCRGTAPIPARTADTLPHCRAASRCLAASRRAAAAHC